MGRSSLGTGFTRVKARGTTTTALRKEAHMVSRMVQLRGPAIMPDMPSAMARGM